MIDVHTRTAPKPATVCCLPSTGYRLLATGYWLLATGYWLPATGCLPHPPYTPVGYQNSPFHSISHLDSTMVRFKTRKIAAIFVAKRHAAADFGQTRPTALTIASATCSGVIASTGIDKCAMRYKGNRRW